MKHTPVQTQLQLLQMFCAYSAQLVTISSKIRTASLRQMHDFKGNLNIFELMHFFQAPFIDLSQAIWNNFKVCAPILNLIRATCDYFKLHASISIYLQLFQALCTDFDPLAISSNSMCLFQTFAIISISCTHFVPIAIVSSFMQYFEPPMSSHLQ